MVSHIPAGWYPDPEHPGSYRYWSGAAWSEHRAPAARSARTPQSYGAVGPMLAAQPSRRGWFARHPILGMVGLVLLVMLVVSSYLPDGAPDPLSGPSVGDSRDPSPEMEPSDEATDRA